MSLAKKALLGFLWTTGANVGSRVLTIISTFILTRYLAPDVQGEVNVAVSAVMILSYAVTFGVAQFIAAHPKEGRDVAFHGAVLVIGGGLFATTIAITFRGPITELVNTPAAAQYMTMLALSQLIERLSWLPRNILVREMQFRLVGMRIAIGELTFASLSVLLAYLDFGGNAIVYANLARSVVALCFLVAVTNVRDYLEPARLRWITFKRILKYGLPINHAALLSVLATVGDNMLMARLFGAQTVGLYNQAYRIGELPGSTIGDQVNDVLVPTFARLDDREARKRALLRAIGLMGLVVFPMAVGLGAVAKSAVAVFYAPSYAGVAPFLTVLATMGILRSLGTLAVGYLQVVGRTLQFIWIEFVLVASILASIALFSPFGPVASACGVGIGFSAHTIILMSRLRPEGISLVEIGKAALGPFLACIPMAVAVLGVRYALSSFAVPNALMLVIEIAVGGVAFVVSAFIVARSAAQDFLGQVRTVIARRRGRAGGASEPPPSVPAA